MLLPKPAFLLLLLPQALTALAAPLTAGDVALAARNRALFTNFATPAHWKRYTRYGTAQIKRDTKLQAALPTPQSKHTTHVAAGQFASSSVSSSSGVFDADPDTAFFSNAGLFTTDLRTALGVAVVGTSAATGREHRFLAHVPVAPGPNAAWDGLVRAVKAARLRGDGGDFVVVVRMPALERDVPTRADGAPCDWSESEAEPKEKEAYDDGRLAAMVRSEMMVLVRANFGVAARVVESPMGAVYRGERDAGTMEVTRREGGGTRVYVDGKVVV